MTDELYYPSLDPATVKALKIVQQLAADHPSYFLTAPWSGEIQTIVEELVKPKKVIHESAPVAPKDGEEEWEFLYRESKYLYEQLKVAGVGLDGNEAMSYFRTSTTLMEKLLGMQERANNLKQVSDFYQMVLDIMESELSPDQRTKVMRSLKEKIKS